MVNTFRYETKQTRSFIRVREIHFFEAHTAHADEQMRHVKLSKTWKLSTDSWTNYVCHHQGKASSMGYVPWSTLHHRHRCGDAKWPYFAGGELPPLP